MQSRRIELFSVLLGQGCEELVSLLVTGLYLAQVPVPFDSYLHGVAFFLAA